MAQRMLLDEEKPLEWGGRKLIWNGPWLIGDGWVMWMKVTHSGEGNGMGPG